MPTRLDIWRATGKDPIDTLRQLAKDGYGSEVAGQIIGVSRPTVVAWARQFCIVLPKRTHKDKIAHSGRSQSAIDAARERNTRWIEWSGGRERLQDAAKRLGITSDGLADRIRRWGVELAMTEPRRPPFYGVKARKVSDSHPWRQMEREQMAATIARRDQP